jgi:translocon-associated protein subunit alpha
MFKVFGIICLLVAVTDAANPPKRPRTTTKKPPAIKHPLTKMPRAAPGVDTSFLFPDHSEKNIPMAETVTLLCHFENNAKSALNITSIMGSLNVPTDFSFYVQNYTQKMLGVIVKPGEEITLEYKFKVDSELEPEKFRLAHTVFYETDKNAYSTTFFNQVRISRVFVLDRLLL